MFRDKGYQGPLLIAALLATALAALLAACNVGTVPIDDRPGGNIVTFVTLDLTEVAPCLTEDGPGPYGGPVPCTWDAATRGDPRYGYVGKRWYVYAEACPVTTVQDPADVACIGRDDWSGGVGG